MAVSDDYISVNFNLAQAPMSPSSQFPPISPNFTQFHNDTCWVFHKENVEIERD